MSVVLTPAEGWPSIDANFQDDTGRIDSADRSPDTGNRSVGADLLHRFAALEYQKMSADGAVFECV